jgi:hypothetical protein
MSLARRLLLLGVLAGVISLALWLALRGGSDRLAGPEAISKVVGWLREEDECPEGIDSTPGRGSLPPTALSSGASSSATGRPRSRNPCDRQALQGSAASARPTIGV